MVDWNAIADDVCALLRTRMPLETVNRTEDAMERRKPATLPSVLWVRGKTDFKDNGNGSVDIDVQWHAIIRAKTMENTDGCEACATVVARALHGYRPVVSFSALRLETDEYLQDENNHAPSRILTFRQEARDVQGEYLLCRC